MVIVTALVFAGTVITAEPVATTLVNDHAALRQSYEYARRSAGIPASVGERDRAAARTYNASIPAGLINDPWGDVPGAVDGPAHDAYLRVLDRDSVMARLRVPAVEIDLPVRHDADGASLRLGAGHMYGSALPVGGPGTHAVLAAHTGWRGATFLDRLPELHGGETVTIDVAGEHLRYRVEDMTIVQAWDLSRVQPRVGRDLLTLVTCITPDGENKQRLLVRASRVPDTAAPAHAAPPGAPAVQSWMWPRIGLTAVGLLFLGVMWIRAARRARRERTT